MRHFDEGSKPTESTMLVGAEYQNLQSNIEILRGRRSSQSSASENTKAIFATATVPTLNVRYRGLQTKMNPTTIDSLIIETTK